MFTLRTLLFSALMRAGCASATASGISDATMSLVMRQMDVSAIKSWEIGARLQAIIEYSYPQYSVFGGSPFSVLSSSSSPKPFELIETLQPIIRASQANSSTTLADGDGSAGDPASLGSAVLLASTFVDPTNASAFDAAVTRQLNHLLDNVPRTKEGAISMREDQAQLWSDNMYMMMPFLAYYGAHSNNHTLIQLSYDQIVLYANSLVTDPSTGLWAHIIGGTSNDLNPWATGNAWAAAGMTRVIAIIKSTSFASSMETQTSDLASRVGTLLISALNARNDGIHTLTNNISATWTEMGFEDLASTALMVATAYRLAVLEGITDSIEYAEIARVRVQSRLSLDGWLVQVTDPMKWYVVGWQSSEAQAFVVMMQAAWRDWKIAGCPGSSSC